MILVVTYDIARKGGIERLSLDVISSLREGNERVEAIYPKRANSLLFGRLFGRSRFLCRLLWMLPQAETVIVMHSLLLKPVAFLLRVCGLKPKLICWLHGIEVWGKALDKVRDALSKCDLLIASSSFTRDKVRRACERLPEITVINPIASLSGCNQVSNKKGQVLSLVTVSRLSSKERYKGHDLIIDTFRYLKSRDELPETINWDIVGDGDDRLRLEELVKSSGLTRWVHFSGSLSDTELKNKLEQCSLMIMPSQFSINSRTGEAQGEGFGIAYLEAAQAGKASIASVEGGQVDLIVDSVNGWLINDSRVQLAKLLLDLHARPEIVLEAGFQAKRYAERYFSQDSFKAKLATAVKP